MILCSQFVSEPSLERFLLLKNLWKDLQYSASSHTPCKRVSLDIDEQPSAAEMAGESVALHNLHLTSESVATRHSALPGASFDSIRSLTPLESPSLSNPLHLLPSDTKEHLETTDPMELSVQASTVLDSPTEMVDMIPSYENMDFQSLVQCSVDQFSSSPKSGSVDELDNIMQVLVGM